LFILYTTQNTTSFYLQGCQSHTANGSCVSYQDDAIFQFQLSSCVAYLHAFTL